MAKTDLYEVTLCYFTDLTLSMCPHKFAAIIAFCFTLVLPLFLVDATHADYILYFSLTFALSAMPFIGKFLMHISLVFGGIIIGNYLVLGQNVYIEQITSVIYAPGDALSMTAELILWYVPVIAFGYIAVSVYLYREIESERLLKGVRMISMPFALIYLALPVFGFIDGIAAYSPLQHVYNYATGAKASNVVIGDVAEPVYLSGGNSYKKIILIIGESQTSFDESGVNESVAPFIHSLASDRNAVILNNVVQSGLFTLVSHTQILEGVSIQDIHKPHVTLYGAAKSNANPWMISSRSWDWGRLSDSMYGFNSYDCSDVIEDCSFIGSADDMVMLKEKIIPLLRQDEYFIVWQMNGSHTPLHDKYTPEFKVTSSDYLSSIKYTDHVMRELFEYIDDDTWVVFMSDHSAERDGSKYKVAAFIANKSFDFEGYESLRDTKLTHFDLLGTVYNLHGVEYTNGEYYNVLTENIPKERSRRTYDFLRTEAFRVVND